MDAGQPPLAVADGNRAPRGLKRWLIALVRRAALAALRPELNELERASAESRGGLERLSRDAAALAGTASVLGADLQRETAAREETRRHLDTRLDEQLSEIARLRDERIPDCEHTQAQLHEAARALQAELERLRDERLPQAQADLTQVHGGLAALQGELERLRDERLPQAEADLARAQQALAVQQGEVERLRDERLPQAEADAGRAQQALTALQTALELVRDERLPKTDADVGRAQQALEALQAELELVRDERLPKGERDLAHLQTALERVQALAEEVRDVRLPALSARCDALVERLYEELAVTAGLAQRLAQHEPLQLTLAPETERQLPTAITAASRAFLDGFRGTREEILGRVQEYVPLLREAAPVLDLGCGRGELLDALQTAGIEARGVDCDPALVKACRRRGLAAEVGDALTTLRGQPGESLGAVAALHLFEHLPAPEWMSIIEAAGAALCRGGLLLVECPNPDSLRVGAGLFWSDPTHRAPLHPAALAFTLRTLGLEVVETRYLHPFAPEEALARPDQTPEVAELARRLDHLLSGPRDFLVIGRKPL